MKEDRVELNIIQSHNAIVPNGAVSLSLPEAYADATKYTYTWCTLGPQGGFNCTNKPNVIWTAPLTPVGVVEIVVDIVPIVPKNVQATSKQRGARAGAAKKSTDGDNTPPGNTGTISVTGMVEVTPNALPLDVVGVIGEGVKAIKDGLPGREIRLERQYPELTPQKALWATIRDRTNAISFNNYKAFIDSIMCGSDTYQGKSIPGAVKDYIGIDPKQLHYRGTEAHDILRKATEAFLMHETGAIPTSENELDKFPIADPAEQKRRLPQLRGSSNDDIQREMENNRRDYLATLEDESRTFPYFKLIRERLGEIPLKPPGSASEACYGILRSRISPPILLELIWSYWHEEGSLVQTLKAITMRFQNRLYNPRGNGTDPLANLNLDPLRPLSNIVWGYIQNEQDRLTVARRAYEYDHHYGFTIAGKAVPKLNSADSRTRFLEAFHSLLHRASVFYKEQSDTTKVPDGYPLLNGLKECHLLLAEGAHNQFGDLPWTARIEMLIEQWLLARPETRSFLNRRIMVPYPEEWMPAVDQMKELQGWKGGTVRHFRDLGTFGEQILLAVRYGDWSENFNEDEAKIWAQYWRQEIQGYINAYRSVTGVDLGADADLANAELSRQRSTAPSVLLERQST